ncbi:MAG TPA: hypothetical protein VI112_13490 [Bacteroidia bacterium]|jgi:hypothetical protein
MLESKHEPPLSRGQFARRITRNVLLAFAILFVSLSIGMIGYHFTDDLGWVDSFYNTCMILTGMGPAAEMKTDGAKLFASLYALYSGVAFLTSIAVVLVPVLHRIMHVFHFKVED